MRTAILALEAQTRNQSLKRISASKEGLPHGIPSVTEMCYRNEEADAHWLSNRMPQVKTEPVLPCTRLLNAVSTYLQKFSFLKPPKKKNYNTTSEEQSSTISRRRVLVNESWPWDSETHRHRSPCSMLSNQSRWDLGFLNHSK